MTGGGCDALLISLVDLCPGKPPGTTTGRRRVVGLGAAATDGFDFNRVAGVDTVGVQMRAKRREPPAVRAEKEPAAIRTVTEPDQ
jgi:hypothetical protein